jgi:predicted dehydrogenase
MIRFGFVGGGGRSVAFATALLHDGRATPWAVCDPVPAGRERFATNFGIERSVATFDELLDHVDAIFIGSPPQHHVPQAVAALERGIHVISEVPAAVSVEQAQELVAATRRSDALYAMAENYLYYAPNLVVRELVRAGEFGDLFYGETEHLADVVDSAHGADGSPNWPRFWWLGRNGASYPTHSLGPLLQWFDDRIIAVSCVGSGRHLHPEFELEDTTLVIAKTVSGRLLRARFSWSVKRPWVPHLYAIQGTKGAYDQGDPGRGLRPAVYFDGRSPENTWEPLEALAERFLPTRYSIPDDIGEKAWVSSDWASWTLQDRWMAQDFVDSILEGRPLDIDVHRGLDMTLPMFAAEASIAQGGAWVHVPNPRMFTAGIGVAPGRDAPIG